MIIKILLAQISIRITMIHIALIHDTFGISIKKTKNKLSMCVPQNKNYFMYWLMKCNFIDSFRRVLITRPEWWKKIDTTLTHISRDSECEPWSVIFNMKE